MRGRQFKSLLTLRITPTNEGAVESHRRLDRHLPRPDRPPDDPVLGRCRSLKIPQGSRSLFELGPEVDQADTAVRVVPPHEPDPGRARPVPLAQPVHVGQHTLAGGPTEPCHRLPRVSGHRHASSLPWPAKRAASILREDDHDEHRGYMGRVR